MEGRGNFKVWELSGKVCEAHIHASILLARVLSLILGLGIKGGRTSEPGSLKGERYIKGFGGKEGVGPGRPLFSTGLAPTNRRTPRFPNFQAML